MDHPDSLADEFDSHDLLLESFHILELRLGVGLIQAFHRTSEVTSQA